MPAQIHKVDPQKTITFEAAGATAAYSLDESLAAATAENGLVSITGKQPGTTHVVVITTAEVQTLEVLVTTPPLHYPPGFIMPVNVQEMAQSGYSEATYYSNPELIQNQLDFVKVHGDDRTNVHIVETTLLGPLEQGQSRTALTSAFYQVTTPRRNITLLDQYVDESPLTLNGAIVRGFHMRQDNWFLHAGYTAVATFQGLFLPTQPELVVGGGYRFPLTMHSSVTAAWYHIQVPSSDLIGHSGDIATVSYKYSPRELFWLIGDIGISHGIGATGRLSYQNGRDNITALARYEPMQFASLGSNNFRGLHTDFAWTRHVTPNVDFALTFYKDNLTLPGLKETTVSGTANFRYQFTRHWAATGGANGSSFQTLVPLSPAIRSLSLPAGFTFQSKYFGGTGQYQFAVTPGSESSNQQFRASLRSGWGAFAFAGYAERDTNAPTLNFILGQVAGLQQELQQLGITATSVQQVDELLSSNSFMIAAGYIKGVTINLVPVRTQIGGSADWSSRGRHREQLSYSFLMNDNHLLQGSSKDAENSLSYSQSVTHLDDLSLSVSVLGVKSPGDSQQLAPLCSIAWTHQFQRVPKFIVPERHGTIAGSIFRDDQSTGIWERNMKPIPGVEVLLDGQRSTITNVDGSYRFANVPRGTHRIAALYASKEPFFFTTASDVEVSENAIVNFGIGYSLSGLMGQVWNDARQGISGITLFIRNHELEWRVTTEADGSFFVSALVAGQYEVQLDEDSLPVGYSADTQAKPQQITVGASAPGTAAFTLRAFRSISGQVLTYDAVTGRYIPVVGAQVILRDPATSSVTDGSGRYLFQNLAAGSYAVSVQSEAQTSTRTLHLGSQPVALINVDFQIKRRAPSN
jgi:hypothetical protein